MDLKCKRTDCKYNNSFSCTAKGITVANTLDCTTFEKVPEKNIEEKDLSKKMLGNIPDIHAFRHSANVEILCKANCLFNEQCRCKANGITVSNTPKSAICITNIKP